MLVAGACTIIIQQLDEHDSKARYRRGRAYLLLGMAKCAKDDFLFILKSPYSTHDGVRAARQGLRELRRIVSQSELEAKRTVCKGLRGGLFSRGRPGEGDFTAEMDSDGEDQTSPQEEETDEFRLPPRKIIPDTPNSSISNSGGDISLPSSPTSDDLKALDKCAVHTPQVGRVHFLPRRYY